jgi:hypothetical protein
MKKKEEDSALGCCFLVIFKKKEKLLRIALHGENFYQKLLQKSCPGSVERYAKKVPIVSMGNEQQPCEETGSEDPH